MSSNRQPREFVRGGVGRGRGEGGGGRGGFQVRSRSRSNSTSTASRTQLPIIHERDADATIQRLRDQLADAKAQIDTANADNEGLRGQINSANDDIEELRDQLADSNAENQRLHERIAASGNEIQRLRQNIADADAEIQRLRQRIADSDEQRNALNRQFEQLQIDVRRAAETAGLLPTPQFQSAAAPQFQSAAAPQFQSAAAPQFQSAAAPQFQPQVSSSNESANAEADDRLRWTRIPIEMVNTMNSENDIHHWLIQVLGLNPNEVFRVTVPARFYNAVANAEDGNPGFFYVQLRTADYAREILHRYHAQLMRFDNIEFTPTINFAQRPAQRRQNN